MDKRKILFLSTPLFKHSPIDTYLNMMLSDNEVTFSWMMNNFINTCMTDTGVQDNYFRYKEWYECPYIELLTIPRNIYSSIITKDIVGFFKDLLKNNYYVYTVFLNTKYLNAYSTEVDDNHNLLIYGFDDKEKIFYTCDYYDDVFDHRVLPYNQVLDAYNHLPDLDILGVSKYDVTMGIRKKNIEDIDFSFDIDILVKKLKLYVNSVDLYKESASIWFDIEKSRFNSGIFGLNIYDKLVGLYEANNYFNARPLNLIFTNQVIMEKRLKYLYDYGFLELKGYELLKKQNSELLNRNMKIRNLFLKNRITAQKRKDRKDEITFDEIMKLKFYLYISRNEEEIFVNTLINYLL